MRLLAFLIGMLFSTGAYAADPIWNGSSFDTCTLLGFSSPSQAAQPGLGVTGASCPANQNIQIQAKGTGSILMQSPVVLNGSGTGLSVANGAQAGTLTSLGDVNVANGSHLWLVPGTIGMNWTGSAISANAQFNASRMNAGVGNAVAVGGGAITPVLYGQVGAFSGTVSGQSDLFRFGPSSDDANCSSGSNSLCDYIGVYTNIADQGAVHVTGGRAMEWTQMNIGALSNSGLEMIGHSVTINVTGAFSGGGSGPFLQPLATVVNVSASGASAGNTLSECDVEVQSGATVGNKGCWAFVLLGNDAVQGSSTDAFQIYSRVGIATGSTPGITHIMSIGNQTQAFPGAPTGDIIGYTAQNANGGSGQNAALIPPQLANLANVAGIYFSNSIINAADFSAGPSGINLGQLSISYTASGVTFDTPRETLSGTPTVSNGGTGSAGIGCYYVGDIVNDIYGDQLKVATVSGCQAATFSVLTRGSTASPPGSPVAMSGGSGTGLTATLTFTTGAYAMSLGPTTLTELNLGNSGSTTTINGTIKAGTSTGLSCSGTPTSSFATVNGIVTHC